MLRDRETIKRALDDYVYARMGAAGLISTPPKPEEHSLSADHEADEAADRFIDALVAAVAESLARGISLDASWAQPLKRELR